MRQIDNLLGCTTPIVEDQFGVVTWTGKADIDGDGSGESHGDPDFQDDTSLHYQGKALNADTDYYSVAPPELVRGVVGIVLGCSCTVTFCGNSIEAVIGDIGPHGKAGEISIALAKALGIPSSPLDGGVGSGVSYTVRPGIAAIAQGRQYNLYAS